MPIYPYSFTLPPVNKQDIPSDGVAGEFLGISAGGVLDWLPVSGGSGSGDLLAANNLSELTPTAGTARTNLGLGTGDSPTFKNLTISTGTITTSAPVTISQTWSTTGTYTAASVNVTETAAAATASKLLDLQVGGVSQFSVSKVGAVVSAFSIASSYIQCNANIVLTTDAGLLVFGVGADTWLQRDGAADTLALRRTGTVTGNTFRVYGNYASLSSYSRLAIACDTSGNATLTTQSTGTAGTVSINGVPVGQGKGTAAYNIAIGLNSLINKTGATQNCAVGVNSGLLLTSGDFNTFIGNDTLLANTTGSYNIAAGVTAGRYITGGATANAITNNSVYLGALTKANASNETNQIVIGYDATGLGSNTAVLGNASITTTALRGNVGIGTTAPSSKLHVAETWNASGTTFAAAKIVVTDTASMAASNLLELWSDAVTPTLKYSFGKSGNFKILGGNNSEINCNQLVTNNGVAGNTDWGVYLNNSSGIILKDTLSLGWSSGVATLGADTLLRRDGEADHLAMRRGALGQKFSVYGTYPGASTWERFTITAPTSGNVLLGTYRATSGVARGLELQVDGSTRLTFPVSGNPTFATAVTFGSDINGQRDVYCGAGRHFRYPNNSAFTSAGAGIVVFEDLGVSNATPRFQLGGTSASFPALKRSTTSLQAVLANDSGFTNIQGKLTTDTDYTATVVTPTGFLTLYDAQGIAYRVPCVVAP